MWMLDQSQSLNVITALALDFKFQTKIHNYLLSAADRRYLCISVRRPNMCRVACQGCLSPVDRYVDVI